MFKDLIHHFVDYEQKVFDYQRFEKLGHRLPENSSKWAAKRKRDYLAGRYCASQCLAHYNLEKFEIIANDDRSPIWPQGYCGSITHTSTYASAVVAPTDLYQSIGIDSEHIMKQSTFTRVKKQIATQKEFDLVSSIYKNECQALTILFSIKEAVFKAVYPLVKRHFYFETFEIIEVQKNYLIGRFVITLNKNFFLNKQLKIKYNLVGDRVDSLLAIKNHKI